MAAAALVLTIRARHITARADPTTTIRVDIGEGLGWLWRYHGLRLLALELGLANLALTMGTTMLVLLIGNVLHGPAAIDWRLYESVDPLCGELLAEVGPRSLKVADLDAALPRLDDSDAITGQVERRCYVGLGEPA